MNTLVTTGVLRPGVAAAPQPSGSGSQDQRAEALPGKIIGVNTAGFALAFAAWVIFGPSVRFIAKDLNLSLSVATLIKTLPVLVGSVMRVPLGILTDRIGARLMFPILLVTSACGVYAASFGHGATQMIVTSLIIGFSGATFVVGVQSVSAWTPKVKQGLALGFFGSGNVGTALTTLGLPLLLTSLGWRASFRVYSLVLAAAAAGYFMLVRNAPRKGAAPTFQALLAPLGSLRTWRFGLYYMATFGTFVAATLSFTDIYIDAFHISVKTAGLLATTFTFTASVVRILGGKLADRLGARPVVRMSLLTVAAALLLVTLGLPLAATVSIVGVAGLAMGIGMAGTFRYIPDYFPNSVGAVGGVVGALGGIGGFLLPQVSTALKSAFGSVYLQVLPLAALALLAALVQHMAILRVNRATREAVGLTPDLLALASATQNEPAPVQQNTPEHGG